MNHILVNELDARMVFYLYRDHKKLAQIPPPPPPPRGGVAVFKNLRCESDVEVICSELRDCVIIRIKNTDPTITAPYIPPHNSSDYHEIYFNNLE